MHDFSYFGHPVHWSGGDNDQLSLIVAFCHGVVGTPYRAVLVGEHESGSCSKMKIIALEGIDNAGKTTVADILQSRFAQKGFVVEISRELTTSIGSLIKDWPSKFPLSPTMKAFLFAADRQLRIENLRRDREPDIVIFDRYLFSAVAYRQAEGLDARWVKEVNAANPRCDCVVLIDLPADESLNRNASSKYNVPYTEDYLDKVRTIYLDMADSIGAKVVDGLKPVEEVADEVEGLINDALGI